MDLVRVPYDYTPFLYKEYKSLDKRIMGYKVRLYFLFDGTKAHMFYSERDMEDNRLLCLDCGVECTGFYQLITVTPALFPDIYNQIKAYEDYVSGTSSD